MSDTPPAASAAPAGNPAPAAAPAAAPATPSTTILGAAPAGNEFLTSLPEEFRAEPSLQSIKDLPALVKGYVHAQRMVGTDKLVLPKADAPDTEWDPVYTKLGRPGKPEEYKFSELELPGGTKINGDLQAGIAKVFHKVGLSQKQADTVRSEFVKMQMAELKNIEAARVAKIDEGEKVLREKWGARYDAKVSAAQKALGTFFSQDSLAALEDTGMGSDPRLVEALANIGEKMLEDTASGQGSGDLGGGGKAAALSELQRLTKDAEFQKVLHDKFHKDHKEAAAKWLKLHEQSA